MKFYKYENLPVKRWMDVVMYVSFQRSKAVSCKGALYP